MVRGLYTAWTGMLLQQNKLDIISNNLANSATTGYKKEGVTADAFDELMTIRVKDSSVNYSNREIGSMSLGAKIGEVYTDYGQGAYDTTDNTYDFALDGDGFFQIAFTNKAGVDSVKYTRDGAFTVTSEGYLTTKDGDFVIGENGVIQIPANAVNVSVDELGRITADGQYVDTFALVDVENYDYLSKYGENMYDLVDGGVLTDSTARVNQGFLEASNVNVVSEMVDMINISRNFESGQKMIQTVDETLDKAVNSVGQL